MPATPSREARADIARWSGLGKVARPGPWKQMDSSRITQARYDSGLRQIQVVFKDGTPWIYDDVPSNIWANLRRSASPGRYVNRVLNAFPYYRAPASWEEIDERRESGEDESPYAGTDLYDDALR